MEEIEPDSRGASYNQEPYNTTNSQSTYNPFQRVINIAHQIIRPQNKTYTPPKPYIRPPTQENIEPIVAWGREQAQRNRGTNYCHSNKPWKSHPTEKQIRREIKRAQKAREQNETQENKHTGLLARITSALF